MPLTRSTSRLPALITNNPHLPLSHLPTILRSSAQSTTEPSILPTNKTRLPINPRPSLPSYWKRHLSTAHRQLPPNPPHRARKPGPSSTNDNPTTFTHPKGRNPVDPNLDHAASEAESIAFASLAFSTSLANTGNPIYSDDFENAPTLEFVEGFNDLAQRDRTEREERVLRIRGEIPASGSYYGSLPSGLPAGPLPLPPYAFTTSIANTGDILDEWDLNTVDPTLSRPAAGVQLPSDLSPGTPGSASTVQPAASQESNSRTNPIDHTTSTSSARNTGNTDNTTTMSDQDYQAFLDKQSGGDDNSMGAQRAKTQGQAKESQFTASSTDTEVPASLQKVDATYTSESDEKFQPVSLSLGSKGKAGARVELSMTGHQQWILQAGG